MIIEEYNAKSLIRKGYISLFAWTDFGFNPYQGCSHDCTYCDGKAQKYYIHSDFGNRVRVKANAPSLLEAFLLKKKLSDRTRQLELIPLTSGGRKATFIMFISGGVCDPYQPTEEKGKLTRRLLQLAYDYGVPVHILTKNKLALRDLDLLKKINEETYAGVNYSITLADEETQKIFEPGASRTGERFEAVKILREAGISSGIYLCPTLPFIGDTDENMKAIFSAAKDAGAQFVQCWGLTLKPGRNKDEFLDIIKEHFPALLPDYTLLFANNHKQGNVDPIQVVRAGLMWPEAKGFMYAHEMGIGYAPPRYIPEGRIQSNLRISEVLLKIAHMKQLTGKFKQAKPFSKAAYFMEKFNKDVSALSEEEGRLLPIPKESFEFITEGSHETNAAKLRRLEETTYKYIKAL